MARKSITTGCIGSLAAICTMFFPVEAMGAAWIPGTISLVFAAVSIYCASKDHRRNYAAGIVAFTLYLGAFLIPMLTEITPREGTIALLFLPLLACILLLGIHTYFGIHVISRGIIFVDLSLAQIASLGTVVSFALGAALHSSEASFYSFGFALIGALIFTATRSREGRLPQEAVIGIVYAVATAAAMLLVDKNPEGMEVIQGSLTGRLLWVDGATIITTSRIFAFVAVFHVIFLEKFLALSLLGEASSRKNASMWMWDFLFYASFGVMITKAVEISGILLVFAFLVIPAVISSLFLKGIGGRLAAGWLLGTVASVIGLSVSYRYDLSAGPAIVSLLTLALIVAGLARHILRTPHPVAYAIKAALALSSLAFVSYIFYLESPLGKGASHPHDHVNETGEEVRIHSTGEFGGHTEGTHALHLLDRFAADPRDEKILKELESHVSGLISLLYDKSPDVRERAAGAMGAVGGGPMVERELEKAFAQEEDEWVRFEMAKALFSLDARAGGRLLLSMMSDEKMPTFLKAQSVRLLRKETGASFGYSPEATLRENREALRQWDELLDRRKKN